MFKKLLHTVSALVLAVCMLTSCSGASIVFEKGTAKPSTGDTWTVLMYLCGGTTSNEIIDKTLGELMSTDYSENINIIVETGGSHEWNMRGIDPDYNQRFLMQRQSMFLAAQTAADNMASSNVLTDYLMWGIENYPAKHYMLIVNGQGGGAPNGAGLDAITGDILTVEDVAVALSATGQQFDIVAFDSSFMSSIETAAQLSMYSRYMVASEDIMCPYGLDYEALGNYLVNNPDSSPEDVGRAMCDSYASKCDKYGFGSTATLAVTDLSRASELIQAFDGMAGMMSFAMDDFGNAARMQRGLAYAEHAGAQSPNEGYTDMADLKNMAETIQGDMGATADTLISLTDEVVTYSVSGTARPYIKGLGVYFPLSGTTDSINRYCTVFPSHNYLTYARKASINAQTELGAGEVDYWSTPSYYTYGDCLYNLHLYPFENGDGCYELDTEGEMLLVRDIYLDIYSHDPKTGESYKVGTKYDIDGDLNGTLFTTTLSKKTFHINGHNVYAKRVERGFGFDIYSVPVLLNGERSNIRISHTYNDYENTYKVLGAWSGINPENGLDSRDFRLLKTGDKITPLFELYGGLGEKEGKSFRIGFTGAGVGLKAFEGRTAYQYVIEDMYGNTHATEMYVR